MLDKPLIKFEQVIDLEPGRYEILGPQGYKPITHIMKTVPYDVWLLELSNGEIFKGADTHILYTDNHVEIFLHEVKVGQLIETDEGFYACVRLDKLQQEPENMYDITVDSNEHEFYANGFTSHNTTCSCIFLLWFAIFNENMTVAILANKQRTAVSIIDDIKKAYELLPVFLKPGIKEYNNLNIVFDNGTKIFASATTEDCLRGETVSLLFCDEFSFLPQNVATKFWNSNFPTISQGGQVILVSTPNGAAGLFYEIYKEAEAGTSSFKPFKVNWWEFPGRDEKWKADMISAIGKVAFNAEYGCSFSGSTNTLIDGDALTKMSPVEPPFNPTPFYAIWKKYIPGNIYGFGIDTAQGAGSDYSVINIFDITTYLQDGKYEQVALYRRNNLAILDFAKEVLELAKIWGNPVLIAENNETGLGNVLCQQLYMEDGYERVYFDQEYEEYGISSNSKTKRLATTYFKQDVEKEKCKIVSKIEINELGIFEEKEHSHGTFAARKGRGFNDDTVSSSYWFAYMLRSPWFLDIADEIYADPSKKSSTESTNVDAEKADENILDAFNGLFGGSSDAEDRTELEKELWRD